MSTSPHVASISLKGYFVLMRHANPGIGRAIACILTRDTIKSKSKKVSDCPCIGIQKEKSLRRKERRVALQESRMRLFDRWSLVSRSLGLGRYVTLVLLVAIVDVFSFRVPLCCLSVKSYVCCVSGECLVDVGFSCFGLFVSVFARFP
jgi:hypothetical protein